MKNLRRFLIAFLLILAVIIPTSFADFGDFESYDSDWGSSWDSDYDSDWGSSWDNDYDSDFGSSWDNSGSNYGGYTRR